MKLLLSLLFSLVISISSFAQNGVYLYGFMENAPATPVLINVSIYADSSVTQAMLFTEPSGNIQTQWVDLPTADVIQFIGAGFTNCQGNYTYQSWNASEFDNLIDIPLNFNYCADSIIYGCTDPTALNYNPQATVDDGSCQYDTSCDLNGVTVIINTQSWGNEITWSLAHDSTTVAGGASYQSNNTYSSNWCLESGCYTLEMYDSFGDGWNGSTFQVRVDGVLIQTGTLQNGNYGSVSFGINQEGCDETPPVSGCTDPLAINYNPFATIDDNSCEYATTAENDLCANATPLIPGNTILINNSTAFQNEGVWGECWGFGEGEGEQTSLWFSFTTPNYPASIHLEALYDGSNTLTDTQFGIFETCGGEMIYCDGNAGEGLMSALNFECGELAENATYLLIVDGWNGDSGTCFLQYEVDSTCAPEILGCTDPFAMNYNPLATENDGSCIYETECTEVTIVLDGNNDLQADWLLFSENGYFDGGTYAGANYSITTCLEDGCYMIDMGTNDSLYAVAYTVFVNNQIIAVGEINNNQFGTFSIGAGCDSTNVVYGCTDPAAINYNPNATMDDGSCQYVMDCDLNQISIVISTQSWGSEISWQLLNSDSNYVASGNGYGSNFEYGSQWCLDDGCYTFEMFDTFGDGWNGGSFEVIFDGEVLASGSLNSGQYGSVNFGINQEGCATLPPVMGCTDPEALNFSPNATEDDGSCQYETNCTDVTILLDNNGMDALWYLNSSENYFSAGYYPGSDLDITACLDDGCYSFQLDSNYTEVYFTVLVGNEVIASEVLVGSEVATFVIGIGCDTTDVVYGCTDPTAINYNPQATEDNGSCTYQSDCTPVTVLIDGFNVPFTEWLITSSSGYALAGAITNSTATIEECLEDGCYLLEIVGAWGDTINFGNYTVFIDNLPIASGIISAYQFGSFEIGSGCDSTNVVYGCTDPLAYNYNPDATADDGSCIYQFECSIDFLVIPDSTGENVIWIMPSENILAAVEVLWDFGDGTTSTDLFPSHEYIGDGPFTLCLTATFASPDGSSCSITYCAVLTGDMVGGSGFTSSDGGFTINVIGEGGTVGLDSPESISNLSLWPNPTTDQLNISFNSVNNDIQTVEIMDITGKIILESEMSNTVGRVKQSIDVSNLTSGVYLFKLTGSDQVETRRFVVTK